MKVQMRVRNIVFDVFDHLVSETPQRQSRVLCIFHHNL